MFLFWNLFYQISKKGFENCSCFPFSAYLFWVYMYTIVFVSMYMCMWIWIWAWYVCECACVCSNIYFCVYICVCVLIHSFINFNGMSTCLGLFYAYMLRNHVYCVFIFTFLVDISLEFLGTVKYHVFLNICTLSFKDFSSRLIIIRFRKIISI